MAENQSRKGSKRLDDDQYSHCGSFSGETFSSRARRRRPDLQSSLRQQSIDSVASKLRQLSFGDAKTAAEDSEALRALSNLQRQSRFLDGKPRWNSGFHYYRFVIIMMGGVSVGLMLLLRYNITIAILKMVDQEALYLREHPNKTAADFISEGYTAEGEFDWDNEIQHMIMSWYMVAYTLPQVLMTRLGTLIGHRLMIPISLSTCALSTILTPAAAYYGWEHVVALRLLNGFGASAVLPMLIGLIENWMPYEQLSLGLTYAQLLQASMSALTPLVSGYLASFHWSYAFYGPAIFTVVFSAAWLVMITDRPDENWLVSGAEVQRICSCTAADGHDHSMRYNTRKLMALNKSLGNEGCAEEQSEREKQSPARWVDIFRVPSFYFFILIWCFHCSAYSGFAFVLPTYLRQYLKIPISQNGLYCGLIQSGYLLSTVWPHVFLRLLREKMNLSETASRRLTHAMSCLVVALTWFYVGLYNDTQIPLLWLNRVFHGSHDIVVTGTLMNNYAKVGMSSLVFSLVNTVGNLMIVFASTAIGWVLDYTGANHTGWVIVYGGLAASQILFMLIFSTCIRAEPIELGAKRKQEAAEKSKSSAGDLELVIDAGKQSKPSDKV